MKILIIDDDASIRKTFRLHLSSWGHEVLLAPNGDSALEILKTTSCDLAVTDLKMPGLSGRELVHRIKEDFPETEVVVITGFATVESAVEVMKAGASDFLVKPLNFDQVKIVIRKIEKLLSLLCLRHDNERLQDRVKELRRQIAEQISFDNLIGKSPLMGDVFDLIAMVAPLECTVTIYGETGTGKEMVAKAMHHNSPRSAGPLITVDCGALAETLLESELFGHKKGAFTGATSTKRGRVELAEGGTLFLDEVGNASQTVQKKLLRLVQEKTFERLGDEGSIKANVRIISAANQDLGRLVKEGTFRQDLYYRLNVVPIPLPPLRNRTEDVPLLARYFLDLYSRQIGRESLDLSHEAIEQLTQHPWPGNVRELSNVMERVAIMSSGPVINSISGLGPKPPPPQSALEKSSAVNLEPPLKEQVRTLEFDYLKSALKSHKGRIKEVAKRSGFNERTIYRKMQLYGLDKADFR